MFGVRFQFPLMMVLSILTIVDDWSRATWVYLLKAKYDVLHIFPAYVEMIAT